MDHYLERYMDKQDRDDAEQEQRYMNSSERHQNQLDTLTIGRMYEVKDSPFTQVPQHFIGYYAGVAFDCASFITENGLIRFSDWDFNEAMEYGEITIIELS